ncbi:MAG: STAS domain-containing protein [Bacteroidetes bacterium]|nr:STAS domain-containing protein [Bacteroidota bacterium]
MDFNFYFTHEDNSIMEVALEGELMEKHQAQNLLNELEIRINPSNNKIILNLQKLKYLNSSGLNVLINILTKCRNAGGEVVVCCLSEKVNQLFLITKLNSVFKVSNSSKEALEYFKS